ncbi:uncharacterized protein [Euwallacea fornicatus]|uniref:uncharacterized protein n=1 Tax=Euwallacea fornicatus TaxID=995702 RepID=UPI00339046C9
MVRKRTRKGSNRRNSRKYYDSDENDSDSDLDLSSPPSSPAPKRYGLRQRKQRTFFEGLDFDEEDDLNTSRARSEDDEYDVQGDLTNTKQNHITRITQDLSEHSPHEPAQVTNNLKVEEDNTSQDISENVGLIDFEDVIRADVVVNNQKVESGSSSVSRTGARIRPVVRHCANSVENSLLPFREKGRRGRKPKARTELLNHMPIACRPHQICDVVSNSQEDDTLEVQIDPLNFVQSHLGESPEPVKSNGVSLKKTSSIGPNSKDKETLENGSVPITIAPSVVGDIEKYVPPQLGEKEKQVVLSNEYLLGNSFDMSADEFLEKLAEKKGDIEEEVMVPQINFDEESSSSDDVILIEKKPEIIVLDDD